MNLIESRPSLVLTVHLPDRALSKGANNSRINRESRVTYRNVGMHCETRLSSLPVLDIAEWIRGVYCDEKIYIEMFCIRDTEIS